MQKQIKSILSGINIKKIFNEQNINMVVSGIKYNSKQILPGDIFVCLQGQHTHGARFITEAVQRGAKCIVLDNESFISDDIIVKKDLLIVIVENASLALARLATNFYDNPSSKMLLIGITGTNGKTTLSYILESIFSKSGYNPGIIGTINYRYNGKIFPSENTTPFSSELQQILYNMYKEKVNVVIMEVSSHALAQGRVEGCEYDVAVFTNLSNEHLDFHQTMENYFESKSLLFKKMTNNKKEIFRNTLIGTKTCVINVDDEWGRRLINVCGISNVLTYGKNSRNGFVAQFKWKNMKTDLEQTQFDIVFNKKELKIVSPFIGEYNVYNVLASFVVAYSQGIDVDVIVDGIRNAQLVPGRLEKLNFPEGFSVIIDYAHTPDALKKVIEVLKQLPHKRLIVVFGCGGDRDRSKRPVMGSIAVELADYVILTSDNPRTEDPQKIILDIEIGIKKTGRTNYEVIIDRKDAIFRAIKLAEPKDIILLAGKGHENYQILGTQKVHFDEREIVQQAIELKRQGKI